MTLLAGARWSRALAVGCVVLGLTGAGCGGSDDGALAVSPFAAADAPAADEATTTTEQPTATTTSPLTTGAPTTAAPTTTSPPTTIPPTTAPPPPPPPPPTTVAPPPPPPPPPPPTIARVSCTPGYDPCIPPGDDVDCAGGSGNGPRYVDGPVSVTGSDPYGLDADHDGIGCES